MLIGRAHQVTAVWGLAALLALGATGAEAEGLGFGSKIEIEPVSGALEIGGLNLELKATNESFSFEGPGYETSLAGADVQFDIDVTRLGIRDADDGANPVQTFGFDLTGAVITCGDNSYTFTSGQLAFTQRTTSDQNRPPPWPSIFVPIGTLVGEVSGTATKQDGESLEVFGIDILDEVLSDEGFSAVTGVQLDFVAADGTVADSVAFSGSFNGDGITSETVIVDHGTCRTLAASGFVSAGPFIVFPFIADRLITIQGF